MLLSDRRHYTIIMRDKVPCTLYRSPAYRVPILTINLSSLNLSPLTSHLSPLITHHSSLTTHYSPSPCSRLPLPKSCFFSPHSFASSGILPAIEIHPTMHVPPEDCILPDAMKPFSSSHDCVRVLLCSVCTNLDVRIGSLIGFWRMVAF